MSAAERAFPSYVSIWGWLVGLLVAGLLVSYLPIGKSVAVTFIFLVAIVKAFLVACHYMHLRSETRLILAIVGIPVLLLLSMTLTLIPDIVFGFGR